MNDDSFSVFISTKLLIHSKNVSKLFLNFWSYSHSRSFLILKPVSSLHIRGFLIKIVLCKWKINSVSFQSLRINVNSFAKSWKSNDRKSKFWQIPNKIEIFDLKYWCPLSQCVSDKNVENFEHSYFIFFSENGGQKSKIQDYSN